MDLLPVATDLPRMFARTSVTEDGVGVVWSRFSDDITPRGAKESGLKNLIWLLAHKLNEEDVASRIAARFSDIIPDGAVCAGIQIPTCLATIFQQVVGEGSGVIGIVKCINQAIVVPAVMALRIMFLKHKVNYKDCRGCWDIDITIKHGEKVIVTHKKWEETIPKRFEFCWHLAIELSPDGLDFKDTTLKIDTIKFVTDNVTDDQKAQLFEAIKEYYDPQSDRDNPHSIVYPNTNTDPNNGSTPHNHPHHRVGGHTHSYSYSYSPSFNHNVYNNTRPS